jgi:hypothetical protein
VSAGSRDFGKGTVVTFALTGLGFIFGGWVLGAICLFIAVSLSLVLWTPLGEYLGFHSDEPTDAPPDPCADLLILLRRQARQLAHILEHFSNWWPAIENKNFTGKLPDGYGPTTHQKAIEKLLFKFGQFFSAGWSYQSFCPNHPDAAEVKALVDEVYLVLGKAGDPGDPTDARIDSDELHSVGRLSTERWGKPEARPFEEVDFKAVLRQHGDEFEALKTFLGEAGPDTSARRRLDEAAKAARAVEQWLTEHGYGP